MALFPDRRRGMGRRRADFENTVALWGLLHDIGRDLATLSYLVELVREAALDDDVTRHRIDLIENELNRLLGLIRDKAAKGPEPGIVPVRPMLEQIVALSVPPPETQVSLSAGKDLRLRIDGTFLWRMVTNLLDNAVRSAGAGGRVEVVARGGPDVLIEVFDDGAGLAEARSSSSVGLGIVTALAAACGGSLLVRPVEPRGTRAQLVFPGLGVEGELTAEEQEARIDLVLGDDHTLFAESLAGVLTAHAFVVRAVARSISGVVAAVREHQPAVCLLDRHFVDGDSVDAIAAILGASARTRVLILTADNDIDGVTRALLSGAQGYVHKSAGFGALADAIARILDEDGVVVEMPGQRAARPSAELAEARRVAAYLTARERECLALIVEGLGTRAMAERLGVSETTVRTHSQRLLGKLGVHSRLEAASFAVRYSLLHGSPGR